MENTWRFERKQKFLIELIFGKQGAKNIHNRLFTEEIQELCQEICTMLELLDRSYSEVEEE